MTTKQGGPGRGQGRKPVAVGQPTVTVSLRMTERQRAALASLGGAPWVRKMIEQQDDELYGSITAASLPKAANE